MSKKRLAEEYGVTPGKLILVGILFVVFVSVVYWNFLREPAEARSEVAAEEPPPVPTKPQPARPESDAPGSAKTPPAAEQPRKSWPRFELADVLARDPFALPEQFPRPAARQAAVAVEASPTGSEPPDASGEKQAAELAALQEKGVQVILRNGEEYVAKIGDRQVRVGDRIGGFRVVDISLEPPGVILEGDASP